MNKPTLFLLLCTLTFSAKPLSEDLFDSNEEETSTMMLEDYEEVPQDNQAYNHGIDYSGALHETEEYTDNDISYDDTDGDIDWSAYDEDDYFEEE